MSRSEFVLRLARRMPGAASAALWLWVRTKVALTGDPESADHWFVAHLSDVLGYRVPLWTRLGNGMKVCVGWNDYIGRTIFREGYYEPEMVALLEKILKPGMVFFDIGAHIGQYSLVASRLVGPRGQVHSFEPDPSTYRWLETNIRTNGAANVVLNQMAVAEETGTRTFYFATGEDIGSNSLRNPSVGHDSGRSTTVTCITLDEYAHRRGTARIDLIKVDVEGAELALLKGARKFLQSDAAPMFILEFEEARQQAFGNSCVKLAEELRQCGYSLFRVAPSLAPYAPGAGGPPSSNVLALHESHGRIWNDLRLPVHAGVE